MGRLVHGAGGAFKLLSGVSKAIPSLIKFLKEAYEGGKVTETKFDESLQSGKYRANVSDDNYKSLLAAKEREDEMKKAKDFGVLFKNGAIVLTPTIAGFFGVEVAGMAIGIGGRGDLKDLPNRMVDKFLGAPTKELEMKKVYLTYLISAVMEGHVRGKMIKKLVKGNEDYEDGDGDGDGDAPTSEGVDV